MYMICKPSGAGCRARPLDSRRHLATLSLATLSLAALLAGPAHAASNVVLWLESMEASRPPRPERPERVHEWENLNFHLRKARFLNERMRWSVSQTNRIATELMEAETSLRRIKRGRTVIRGLREEGYYSAVDDSFQPFRSYIPERGRLRKPAPLIVYLHGYSPGYHIHAWPGLPPSLIAFAAKHGFYLVAPFGRSNTDFQGIGEQDTLRAIAEMKKRYRIDEDRVILTGHSMGGMGVWTIGAHYPHLFAGLYACAARGDYHFWQNVKREEQPPYKRTLIDAEFGYSLLPNLAQLPILIVHGGDDLIVPTREGRHMADALRAVNSRAIYREYKGANHHIIDDSFKDKVVQRWLLERRREPPAAFNYQTYNTRYTDAYWLTARAFSQNPSPATWAGRVEKNEIVLEASGVTSLIVHRDRMPVAWRKLPIRADKNVAWSYAGAPPPAAPLRGSIKHAFLNPFILVQATTTLRPEIQDRTLWAMQNWYGFAKALPRYTDERRVARATLASHNIFLVGEPEHSALIRRVLANSEVRAEGDAYIVGERRFKREGNGLYILRPSPWNPQHVAVVQLGHRWGEGLPSNHKYDLLPEFIVYTSERDWDGSNSALCAGFFGPNWSIDERSLYVR